MVILVRCRVLLSGIRDRVWYDVPPASWQCAIDSYRAWFGMSHVQGGSEPQICLVRDFSDESCIECMPCMDNHLARREDGVVNA